MMKKAAMAGALGVGVCIATWGVAADSDAGLQEIVVTAQKREESAQNVAIAMTVISGSELADKSISYVNDLANATPSLQVEPAFGSSQPEFRLRGVGFIDYTSNNASPVGVNIDGVALALPIQTQGQLFDLDRVEVLRGPQGTLYGRNSTGGIINFVSNRPTEETHYGAQVEWGSHNLFTSEDFISGTIAPTLTGRLSVATEQGGAWQRDRTTGDSLGDKDKVAVRGQLQWTPNEVFDAHLALRWAQDKSDEQGLYLLQNYPVGLPTQIPADTSPYLTGWHLNPAFAALIGLPDDAKPGLDDSNFGTDLTANVNFGGFAKLTSITAWNRQIRREYGDWDATLFDDSDEYLRSNLQVFSQELRLASANAGALQWVLGGIYSHEFLTEDFYSDVLHSPDGGVLGLTTYAQAVNSVGVFGQASYQLSDQFKVSLGVREDHENRQLEGLNTSFLAGALGVVPSLNGGPQSRVAVSNLPSGKFELDYTPVRDTLLYASVSRGVKSGGFTAHNTFTAAAVDPFNPERLTAYEIGVKSDLTHALRVNAALYDYRYRDQQILSKVLDAVAGYVGRFANVNSRISGAELEVDWVPVKGFTLSQYAGYVVGYYEGSLYDFVPTAASPTLGTNYDGRPESIPKWSYGGDASYVIPLGDYKLTPEINWSMHDTYSQFFLLLGSNAFTIPTYWLANANLTLAPAAGPWSVSLWGRNIFDRRYDLTRNFFLATDYVAAAGEPATFGIRFNYKY